MVKKSAPAKKGTAKKVPAAKAAKKSALKTKPTPVSVRDFIAKVENPQRRKDAETALAMYRKITGVDPEMWGPTIVG